MRLRCTPCWSGRAPQAPARQDSRPGSQQIWPALYKALVTHQPSARDAPPSIRRPRPPWHRPQAPLSSAPVGGSSSSSHLYHHQPKALQAQLTSNLSASSPLASHQPSLVPCWLRTLRSLDLSHIHALYSPHPLRYPGDICPQTDSSPEHKRTSPPQPQQTQRRS